MGIIIIFISWVIGLLIYYLPRIPRKKLIVNPSYYEYENHTYIYVDNRCYGNIHKREEIGKEEIDKCIDDVIKEIDWRKEMSINNSQINSIFHLREIVRKYKVKADREVINRLDECIGKCDYHHTCILLEVRAILQLNLMHKIRHSMQKVNIALFMVAILVAALFFCNTRTILPVVNDDEYYETSWIFEKEGWEFVTIHSKDCPHKKNLWIKKKYKKYDILIKNNADICRECIDEDEAKKLIMLHNTNLEKVRKFQSTYGVEENLSEYNTEATIDNVYYMEELE